MIKGFKVRLYPTKEQERLFWKHIGSCRFLWNYMIDWQKKRYEDGEKYASAFTMNKHLTELKNDGEHGWLYEVSNSSLQTTCRDLDKTYKEFFKKKKGYPKFKSRKTDRPSFPINVTSFYFKDDKTCNIQKIGKVRYKTNTEFPIGNKCKFTNPRVSYEPARKKWILSFGMELQNEAQELTDNLMGVDLGIKELAVVANGDEELYFHNINKSKRIRTLEKKKRHIQENISRKYESSRKNNGGKYVKTNGIIREEQKLREVQARINGIRENYTHQVTNALVKKLPKRITVEDLNVSGMMKNKHLSKAVQEQRFFEVLRQIEYKCEWNGIEFVKADRFYPSSKTCSRCGHKKDDLKLSDRVYVCPECGLEIDRDFNAALNLQKYVAPNK